MIFRVFRSRLLLVTILTFGIIAAVYAKAGYMTTFTSTYSAYGVSSSALNDCILCHTASMPALNSYGNAFKASGHSYTSIEGLDSDGDGFTNLQEIMALTFPGNPASKPAGPPPDTTAPTVTAFSLPAASNSLTVAISSFTATDNTAVTGYMVKETSTAPTAGAAGWSGTAPVNYAFASAGSKTLYAWAKDAAGNVSASRSASTTVDTTVPSVTSFTIPATSNSLTVLISAFAATDNIAVTGYMATENATAPSASAAGWSGTAPVSYAFGTSGAKTLYAWAKDAAGNVSASRSASTTIDATVPVVTAFTIPATSNSLTIAISSFVATDNVAVTGYMATETSTAPSASAAGWFGTAPASYTFIVQGAKTLYAWAKDAVGNVSASRSASTTIDTTAPTVASFSIPAANNSLTVAISAFTATDNVAVTGYMATETSTAPSASAAGWSGTVPANYTFGTAGGKTLYAWAKDAVGNVSASRSASTTIDTTLPTVTSFSIPASSASLIVAISAFAATDNVAVTGYLTTESSTAPLPSAAGWSAAAPVNYSFATAGAKTLYAWAKDAAGNVSASQSASTTIALADTAAPTVTSFSIPAAGTSLTVAISAFAATDNVAVTGYIVTESSIAPAAGAAGWSGTTPANYTCSAAGARTLYAWAKDAAGNVSVSRNASITITLPDSTAPMVTSFSIPASGASLTVAISTFVATDNIAVTGYMATESSTAPSASATGWSATPPASYTFATAGAKSLYAWAKDAAGNVSASRNASTMIDRTAPTVTSFSIPATGTSLTVAISSLAATDNVGVTAYMVTESSTAPAAGAAGWAGTAPANYSCSAAGARTLYAWAKDAVGNVSASRSASTTITLLDTTAPTISITLPTANSTYTATSSSLNISGAASDNVGVTQVTWVNNRGGSGTATGTSSWSVSAITLQSGSNVVTVTGRDAAGNSATDTLTVTYGSVDTTPPVISAVTSKVIRNRAVISWLTNESADSQVEYGLSAAYGNSTAVDSSLVTSHSVTIPGLQPKTLYHYRVWSRDAQGNRISSADYSFQIKAMSIVYPQISQPLGNALAGGEEYTGVALSNLDSAAADLTFTMFDETGTEPSTGNLTNPKTLPMEPGSQMSDFNFQLFGDGISQASPLGYVNVDSSSEKLTGFFLTFNSNQSSMDGAQIPASLPNSLVLPEVGEQGFTKYLFSNPNDKTAAMLIQLVGSDGSVRSSVQQSIGANGTVLKSIGEIFPGVQSGPSDYVRVSSDIALLSYETFGDPDHDLAMLAGQDAGAPIAPLYSPQYVVGGRWRSTLSIINLDSIEGTVSLKLIWTDGRQVGQTRVIPIPAAGKLYISDQTLFTSGMNLQLDRYVEGYIEITGSVRLTGSVVFGDSQQGIFRSALPLVAELQTSAVFTHVASNDLYYTGLAIVNPNLVPANATIEMFDSNGLLIESVTRTIPARQRLCQLLTQYFPSLVGQDQTSGYFKVTVDQPVACFALIGTHDYKLLSAIPTQPTP